MTKQTIVLAADHAGFAHKEAIKPLLKENGYEVVDVGAHELKEGDDYPVYMSAAAIKVAEDLTGNTKAVIFGGSGQGEAMVANRFPGVRADVWYGGDQEILKRSRADNDANVLSIGARFIDADVAGDGALVWLKTEFSGDERHKRRIEQIDAIE